MNDNRHSQIDLFAGIGGFALAFEREGFRTIGHAEVEPFACAVYHGHFPASVCFGGVQNVTRDSVLERCGELPVVVTGGFPCQPHSVAGKRKASADDRDLWGECVRVLRDLRPRFALFENVGGLLTSERGLFYNRVLSDLAEIRFACLWQVVSAADVGAPHRRERIWLLCVNELADGNGSGCSHGQSEIVTTEGRLDAQRHLTAVCGKVVADEKEERIGGGLADCHEPRLQRFRDENQLSKAGQEIETGGSGFDESMADADKCGRNENRESAELRPIGIEQPSCDCGESDKREINQEWPSRPGQPQHEWEPPRVVADAAKQREQREQRDTDCARAENGSTRKPESGSGSEILGDTEHAGLHADEISRCDSARNESFESGEKPSGECSGPSSGELDKSARKLFNRRGTVAEETRHAEHSDTSGLQIKSALGGNSDGLPAALVRTWPEVHNRVGQLKGFGNAIVPAVAQIFARAIQNQLTK